MLQAYQPKTSKDASQVDGFPNAIQGCLTKSEYRGPSRVSA